jgi:hypothetical protein
MKIVINGCHGGFGLSDEAIDRYIELKGLKLFKHYNESWKCTSYFTVPYEEYEKANKNDMTKTEWERQSEGWGRYKESNDLCWSGLYQIERNDPALVQVVEEMDHLANNTYSQLKVVEVPDDVEWYVEEYDGWEWVAEKHRIWR